MVDWAAGAMTAEEYDRAMQGWVDAQAHSGPEQKEKYAEYTGSMQRERGGWPRPIGSRTPCLHGWIQARPGGHHWVVITESWCGDAVQCLPLIRMWAERGGVPLDVVLRDGRNGIMDDFLTNGGRSIPVWIVADGDGRVLGQWGPRPATARDMVLAHRQAPSPNRRMRSSPHRSNCGMHGTRGRR